MQLHRHFNKIGIVCISLIVLSACPASRLQVRSTPDGAEVFVTRSGQPPEKIGVTPLQRESGSLFSGTGESVRLLVRKTGYLDENFLIPRGAFSSSVNLLLEMRKQDVPDDCSDQAKAVETVARSVAKVQAFIQAGRFEAAERMLNQLIDSYPSSNVFYDLMGNTYYLKKDMEQALTYYERSLELNPSSPETRRIVEKLRSITGRSPAGGTF